MKELMSNGFVISITQAIEEMKAEQRDSFFSGENQPG